MVLWVIGLLCAALANTVYSTTPLIINGYEISEDRVTGNGWDVQPNRITGPSGFLWEPSRFTPTPPKLPEEINKYVWCPRCLLTEKYGVPTWNYEGPVREAPQEIVHGFAIYPNRVVGHGWDVGEKVIKGHGFYWETTPDVPTPPKLPDPLNQLVWCDTCFLTKKYGQPTWVYNQPARNQEKNRENEVSYNAPTTEDLSQNIQTENSRGHHINRNGLPHETPIEVYLNHPHLRSTSDVQPLYQSQLPGQQIEKHMDLLQQGHSEHRIPSSETETRQAERNLSPPQQQFGPPFIPQPPPHPFMPPQRNPFVPPFLPFPPPFLPFPPPFLSFPPPPHFLPFPPPPPFLPFPPPPPFLPFPPAMPPFMPPFYARPPQFLQPPLPLSLQSAIEQNEHQKSETMAISLIQSVMDTIHQIVNYIGTQIIRDVKKHEDSEYEHKGVAHEKAPEGTVEQVVSQGKVIGKPEQENVSQEMPVQQIDQPQELAQDHQKVLQPEKSENIPEEQIKQEIPQVKQQMSPEPKLVVEKENSPATSRGLQEPSLQEQIPEEGKDRIAEPHLHPDLEQANKETAGKVVGHAPNKDELKEIQGEQETESDEGVDGRGKYKKNKGFIKDPRINLSLRNKQGRQVGLVYNDDAVVRSLVYQENGNSMRYVYRNNVLVDKFQNKVKQPIPAPSQPSPISTCEGIEGINKHNIDFTRKFHKIYQDEITLLSDVTPESVHLKTIDPKSGDLYDEKYTLGPKGKLIFQKINGAQKCLSP